MNPRIAVTASLLPLAALAAAVAPALAPRVHTAPLVHTTPATPATPAAPTTAAVLPVPVDGPAGVHVTVTPDRTVLYADGDRRMRVRVDWWADASGETRATPTDLIVVLDRSGSMVGEKMLDARAAATELVSLLGPEDRFALVSFSSEVRVDVPLSRSTDPRAWTDTIARIEPGGGTGMVDGLAVGLGQAVAAPGRSRRVVLISDGQPDTAEGLEALAAGSARHETPLTTIGIGLDYDEALMQSLADRGAGNFYWAQRGAELQGVLAAELSTARQTVASGVRLSSTGGARVIDAGGMPVQDGRVELGTLYAGQHRSLWVTVELPESGAATWPLGTFALGFTPPEGAPVSLLAVAPSVSLTHDAEVAYAALGDDWADAVVTDDYNRLRTAVSASVQAGDQQAAMRAISAYQVENAQLNAWAANPRVTDNLRELDALAADVNAQFVGADQRNKQNTWSKGTRVDSYSKRRVGQVMPGPAPMPASR